LNEVFNQATSVVLNDFTGLDVEKISQLRKLCREAGIEYLGVKNAVSKRGIKGTQAEELEGQFGGPTALAIGRDSENVSAKILADFAEEHEGPKFKAAVVSGKVIDASAVLALSKIPPREELLSQLLGGIQAPANGLVTVLQGTLRNLLYGLNAIIEKKQAEGDTGTSSQESEQPQG
jgi:large subunit ribosomal protein L10